MINNLILVGRIYSEPEIVPTKEEMNAKWGKFILAVERPFRNRNNDYEIDFITVKTWLANIENIKGLLKSDTIIGIKGRIQTFTTKNSDFHYTEIIADKITYIQ